MSYSLIFSIKGGKKTSFFEKNLFLFNFDELDTFDYTLLRFYSFEKYELLLTFLHPILKLLLFSDKLLNFDFAYNYS